MRKAETETVLFQGEAYTKEGGGEREPGEGCTWGIAGESLDGEIGWYCRYGTHYLSILDWEQVIRYREIHNI